MPNAFDRVAHDALRALAVAHRAAVGDRLAAGRLDLARRRSLAALLEPPLPSTAPPRSFTDHLGAPARQLERVRPAESAAGAGDDGDLSVESMAMTDPPGLVLARIAAASRQLRAPPPRTFVFWRAML